MSGFELFDADTKMRITLGSRTVLTTDGTLINLLPPSEDISETFTIAFPDIIKDYWYNWQHVFSYTSLGGRVAYDSFCATYLTACPQEFEQETTIIAAPPYADIFVGEITLTRTIAPSHAWDGVTIQPIQPMGVVIPFVSGSLLMEKTAVGLARACSIFVQPNVNPALPGSLILNREHSVSTPPEGWGLFGNSFNGIAPSSGSGGENVFGSLKGIPVIQYTTNNVPVDDRPASPISQSYDSRTRIGGPNACALPNPAAYDYGSTYQATLTGAFGRRS